MAKFYLTEGELKQIVKESVKKILSEDAIKGMEQWEPLFDKNVLSALHTTSKDLEKYIQQGMLPSELDDCFEISAMGDNYTMDKGDYLNAPQANYDKVRFGGDYNKVINIINSIQNPNVKNVFAKAFKIFCDGIELNNVEKNVPEMEREY